MLGRPRIDVPATKSPTLRDIIGAAFFYEGEGHVRDDTKGGLKVVIGANDRERLDWFKERFGGIIYGPYPNAKRNNTFQWVIRRERALGFMLTIYSFLVKERKEQFKSVLSGGKSSREYKKATNISRSIQKLLKNVKI